MSELDPRIEVIRLKYGLERSDFWELPQKKGTWVAKHAALEIAAAKAGIKFDMPVIIEHDALGLITSMVVRGEMGDAFEWSVGETNPTNYRVTGKQPSYPWAMSEKRAKDRVILKLIGIHGLTYSEDEADDFRASAPVQNEAPAFVEPSSKAKSRGDFDVIMSALLKAGKGGKAELRTFWTSPNFNEAYVQLPLDWQTELVAEKDGFIASYEKPAARMDPNASLDRQFAQTMGDPIDDLVARQK